MQSLMTVKNRLRTKSGSHGIIYRSHGPAARTVQNPTIR